jgi:hypothetical protein
MKDGWELYDESNPEHNDPNLYSVMEWSANTLSKSPSSALVRHKTQKSLNSRLSFFILF